MSLEAEILPPQAADQTRTTLPWEILLEIHQQIDACALVLRNQYPAQSFPRAINEGLFQSERSTLEALKTVTLTNAMLEGS